jgi:hypothetical protein
MSQHPEFVTPAAPLTRHRLAQGPLRWTIM